MQRSTGSQITNRQEDQRQRPGPFRIWVLCAVPWLMLVSALSVYDHHRAIDRMAGANAPEGSPAFAVQWVAAALDYAGSAIAFYGLLPLGIAFFLFVVFLPWAIPWAQSGDYES
ncbi:hypothetical protein [Dongia deserti]|uniref:hypothetical protein n=1 Tax=Dongia deserti TaxID=2268030 RepID=UPI000E651D24|nr:hypothetical protein [Dongia deserti]